MLNVHNHSIMKKVRQKIKPTNLKFEITPKEVEHKAVVFRENSKNIQSVIDANIGLILNSDSESGENQCRIYLEIPHRLKEVKFFISKGVFLMTHTLTPEQHKLLSTICWIMETKTQH